MKLLLENWRRYIEEENKLYGDYLFGQARRMGEVDVEEEAAMWTNIMQFLAPSSITDRLSRDTINTLLTMKKNINAYPPDYKNVLMPPMTTAYRGTKLDDFELAKILTATPKDVANQWYESQAGGKLAGDSSHRINPYNPLIKVEAMIYESWRGRPTSWSGDKRVAAEFAATMPRVPRPKNENKAWGAVLYAELSDNRGFIMNFNEIPAMAQGAPVLDDDFGEREVINLLPQTTIYKIAYWPIGSRAPNPTQRTLLQRLTNK